MRNQKVMRFVKRIISLPILFLIGCGDVYEPEVSVEPYCNMPVVDGVPTLALRDTWQTTHMIDFKVTLDGEPVEYATIRFESNLYWVLGDTLGYIVDRALTDDWTYINYDTTYVTGFGGAEVPTTNFRSMTDDEGLTSNAIAPVRTMDGETMILSYSVWVEEIMERVYGEIEIKLEK